MKDFLKFTLATVTGIIVSSVVLFFISILVVFSMVSSSESETQVRKNSVMMLDLNGTLAERSQENPLDILMKDDYKTYGLDDVLSSIRKAKENENIKGIYIQANSLSAGYASLEEIRHALKDFKESGKFIVAYGRLLHTKPLLPVQHSGQSDAEPARYARMAGIGSHPDVLQRPAGKDRRGNASIQSGYIQIGS